jgi:hypothetical protein
MCPFVPTQWMAAQGYNTYYTGKLFVEYTNDSCTPPPAGWADIDALTYPNTFEYYNPAFSRNGEGWAAPRCALAGVAWCTPFWWVTFLVRHHACMHIWTVLSI